MTLSLQIFTDYTRAELLADYSEWPFRFSTNEHGFAALELPFIPENLPDAFAVYDWPGTPWAVVTGLDGTAWEGRLEDLMIVPGGVQLGALGAWRALGDVPYTGLWSKTGTAGWRETSEQDGASRRPAKFNFNQNNRVYISLKKNQIYASTAGASDVAGMAYLLPHNGNRNLVQISYTYDVKLPTNWRCHVVTFAEGFSGGAANDRIFTGNGASQTGTETVSLTAGKQVVEILIFNNTGSAYTNTGEDDAWYVKFTGIRVTSQAPNILASDIAAALVTYVNGINSDQLSSSTALIEATSDDLQDEVYEDAWPADILDRLALLHGYEAGVWEDRKLHFRAKGSAGRHWYVNVTRIMQLQRSLENIRNSAYGVYQDANGRTLRTAVADDAESQARLAVIRRAPVAVQTTSATQAGAHRDVFLSDRADFQTRAVIEFETIEDEAGAEYPLYMMRAHDTVTMRNLPPVLSEAIDNIRTFLIGQTEVTVEPGQPITMNLEPESPVPTLVSLIARREAGLR